MKTIMHRILNHKFAVPVLLAAWTFVVLLLCCKDSYLYMQLRQFDSACFFMCGKALANGLLPYADFADSKGILLWFIYAGGYLFDNYSYVGIFWLSCVSVWVTLMISYRTARLFLSDVPALLCAMAVIVPLTHWNFYYETKAEHFCWPAVAWGIYVMMQGALGRCASWRDYVLVGVAVVTCLFLKWNVAIMSLSLVCSIGWYAWRDGNLRWCVSGIGAGAALAMIPFLLYFSAAGIWDDVWREYFCNTMASVNPSPREMWQAYLEKWQWTLLSRRVLFLLFTLPAFLLWRRSAWFSSALPGLCALCFLLLSVVHDMGHYVTVCTPFVIVPLAMGLNLVWDRWRWLRLRHFAVALALAVIYNVWGSIRWCDGAFCTDDASAFDKVQAVSAAMSQIDHPRVIYIGLDKSLCMATMLPATRYWMTQAGKSEEMWQSQKDAIMSGAADFIFPMTFDGGITADSLAKAGYHPWTNCILCAVWTKHPLPEVTDIRHFTVWDIITKKNYREMYED